MISNYRAAFSLLELIFVILIVAILAAVALPRFMGISEDAHVTKLQAFTGTLDRTVGPQVWSGVLRNEPIQKGSVKNSLNYSELREGIELETIPEEFIDLGIPRTISLANCLPSTVNTPDIGDPIGSLTDGKIAKTTLIGSNVYALGCIDGSLTISPRFFLYNETKGEVIY